MRMMSVVEHYGDDKLLAELVLELLEPLLEVAGRTESMSLEAARARSRRASSSEYGSGASGVGGSYSST